MQKVAFYRYWNINHNGSLLKTSCNIRWIQFTKQFHVSTTHLQQRIILYLTMVLKSILFMEFFAPRL